MQSAEGHWVTHRQPELVLVGCVDVVAPSALHAVAVDGLVDVAGQEGIKRLLGVAVDGPEVQHLGAVQGVGQLLKRPEAAKTGADSVFLKIVSVRHSLTKLSAWSAGSLGHQDLVLLRNFPKN